MESVKYLFTTKTCPNCKIAKEILKGEDYQIIDAEENQDLVRKYGIMQAPTLVVTDGTKSKEIRECVKHQEICGRCKTRLI